MKQQYGVRWAFVAAISLAPALALASPGVSAAWARAGGGERLEAPPIGSCRPAAESAKRTALPPRVTHRPRTPGAGALEAHRRDPRDPRAPTSGWPLTASRRDRARCTRLSGPTRDEHVVAPAAAFHEAHAPPHGLLAVAGWHS